MRERLEALLVEYGSIALVIYLVIFGGTLTTFWFLIQSGFEVEGAAQQGGTLFAAWLATKATQPIRIGATLAATPVVGKLMGRKADASGGDEFAPRPEMASAELETTTVDE